MKDITLFENQIHLTTILTYGVVALWTFLHARKNNMNFFVKIVWISGVLLVNIFFFESIWGILVGITHGGTPSPMIFWGTLIQTFGFPLVLLVKRDFHIKFNFNEIFLFFLFVTGCLFITWFVAPFPHEVVKSYYFPQEFYEHGVYVPNILISALNKISKAFLAVSVTYLLLGEKRDDS